MPLVRQLRSHNTFWMRFILQQLLFRTSLAVQRVQQRRIGQQADNPMASVNIIGERVGAEHSRFQKLLTEIHYYTEQRGNQAVGNNFKAPKNQDQKKRVNWTSLKTSAFLSVLFFGT